MVGSGNWGSVIGKIVAQNVKKSYVFHDEVSSHGGICVSLGHDMPRLSTVNHVLLGAFRELQNFLRSCGTQEKTTNSCNNSGFKVATSWAVRSPQAFSALLFLALERAHSGFSGGVSVLLPVLGNKAAIRCETLRMRTCTRLSGCGTRETASDQCELFA